jgi:hypothetical protein
VTTKAILRSCGTFEIATGVALIIVPGFVVGEIFGGSLSDDIAIAGLAGLGPLLLLGLVCWPTGDAINARLVWSQLAYTSLTALYLGFLRLESGFGSALLWPTCALHGLIAILLGGMAYERFSITKSGRTNQHYAWPQTFDRGEQDSTSPIQT